MSDLLFVLLRGSGTLADVRRTTDALGEHAPNGVRLEVIGPPDSDDTASEQRAWQQLRKSPAADVVLLEVGCAVGPGWYEQLREAAYDDAVIATASAVPADVLAGASAGPGSRAPAGTALRGTALGEPLWGCVYLRRDALDIALAARGPGGQQPRLEEVLLVPGLVHVLASNVVSAVGERLTASDEGLRTPSIRRALGKLEAELEPLRVTVDLRCCAYQLSGTQVHALNLVTSLASDKDLRLSVLLPTHIERSVRRHVDALPASIRRIRADRADADSPQVFHRPYQLLTENEITDVLSHGARLVLTHQDMILDRTPAYFPSKQHWRGYTAATALSFLAADEVAFFSEHARREAVEDGLVDPAKTSVVPPGTDHIDADSGGETRPKQLGNVVSDGQSFIFVLCNSYFHKNRVYALRVAEELRRKHGWDGALVFAGGAPPDGSSAADEAAFLGRHPELRARFVGLGRVSDDEQRWLYRHAALVLYPSLYEGFGLIPFEAAAVGTPCVYSSRSSVAEYLPAEGALLDLRDAAKTAERLSLVLEGNDSGIAVVRAIRNAGKALTWESAAASYAAIYRRATERPVGLALVAGGDVVVGGRSQLAENETERRLLFVSRRFGAVRRAASAAFALGFTLRRVALAARARLT